MNEVFAEYIIQRKITVGDFAKRMISVFFLFTCFVLFLALGPIGLAMTALAIYVVYYVFSITNVEYEYSLVNSDLVVDKIMGQRKRKRMSEFDLKRAEVMAYVNSNTLDKYEQRSVVKDYSSGTNNKNAIVIAFVEGADTTLLIFEPNDRIIEGIRKIRPGIVKLEP